MNVSKIKNTTQKPQKLQYGRGLTNQTVWNKAPTSTNAIYGLGGQEWFQNFDSPIPMALATTPLEPIPIGKTLVPPTPTCHTTTPLLLFGSGLYPAWVLLYGIWSIGQMGFSLRGSPSEWAPFLHH